MQKIKKIYNKSIHYLKNLSSMQKKYIGLSFVLIVLAVLAFQIFYIQSKTDKNELSRDLDSAISYLNEAKKIKNQYINNEIDKTYYDKREGEIEIAVEEIVQRFQTMQFKDDVKIDRDSLISTGDALQVLIYVIYNSKDIKDLNDEILALSIIMEEIKSRL